MTAGDSTTGVLVDDGTSTNGISTDFTGMPVGTNSWGTGSGGWPPVYNNVYCSPDAEGGGHAGQGYPGHPGGAVYPGSSTGGIGHGGVHGIGFQNVHCSVNGMYGSVYYNCDCGDSEYRNGQLAGAWFMIRPESEQRIQGCLEIFKAQCGNTRNAGKVECSTDYGTCSVSATVRDDDKAMTKLNFGCSCVDRGSWYSSQRVAAAEFPSLLSLNERCEEQVARCGRANFGRAGSGLLLSAESSLEASCESPFGNCYMTRHADGRQSLNCGCRGGERKSLTGNLGWADQPVATVMDSCGAELARCAPEEGEEMDMGDAVQTTGASLGTGGTSTQAANAAGVDPVADQVRCAMGDGPGRFGYTCLGALALLGWRRRRN